MTRTRLIRVRTEDVERMRTLGKEEYLRHNKNMRNVPITDLKMFYEMLEFYLKN